MQNLLRIYSAGFLVLYFLCSKNFSLLPTVHILLFVSPRASHAKSVQHEHVPFLFCTSVVYLIKNPSPLFTITRFIKFDALSFFRDWYDFLCVSYVQSLLLCLSPKLKKLVCVGLSVCLLYELALLLKRLT